jgi:hypothetical protein
MPVFRFAAHCCPNDQVCIHGLRALQAGGHRFDPGWLHLTKQGEPAQPRGSWAFGARASRSRPATDRGFRNVLHTGSSSRRGPRSRSGATGQRVDPPPARSRELTASHRFDTDRPGRRRVECRPTPHRLRRTASRESATCTLSAPGDPRQRLERLPARLTSRRSVG